MPFLMGILIAMVKVMPCIGTIFAPDCGQNGLIWPNSKGFVHNSKRFRGKTLLLGAIQSAFVTTQDAFDLKRDAFKLEQSVSGTTQKAFETTQRACEPTHEACERPRMIQ